MWAHPYVACMGLVLFHARAIFSVGARRLFPQCMLAVIPLIGGVTDILVSSSCTGYWAVPPLCSMAVTALSGVGVCFLIVGIEARRSIS